MKEGRVKPWPEAGSRRGIRRDDSRTDPGVGFEPPVWAREGLIYCAYLRAASVEGTFEALARRLPDIRSLGATAIWLLPIHPTGVAGRKGSLGSPYAIRDYFEIDPAYGSPDDFRSFIRTAHAAGLRVMMDLVLNHAALDHPGVGPGSFHVDSKGNRTRRESGWSDVADWNFESPVVREHLLSAVTHWIREFDIDGYRCDVAGMVPADFWAEARKKLLTLKPDHLMLAEWDDPAVHRSAFHASYDWKLYRNLVRASRGSVPAGALSRILEERHSGFPRGAAPFRFVENHDEPRFMRRFGSARWAVASFVALAGGLFLIYNGQEIGADHRPDLFEREPIDWGRQDAESSLIFWSELLAVRSEFLEAAPAWGVDAGASPRVAAYERRLGDSSLVVAVNFSGRFERMGGALLHRVGGRQPVWMSGFSHGRDDFLPPRSTVIWIVK